MSWIRKTVRLCSFCVFSWVNDSLCHFVMMRRWNSSSLSINKIICRHLGQSHYKLIFKLDLQHSVFTELGYHEQINILRNMELEKEKNENRRKSRRKSSYKSRYKKSFNSKMLEVISNGYNLTVIGRFQ